MWKPTQQENLGFHGGNLHQSRQRLLAVPGATTQSALRRASRRRCTGLQEVHHAGDGRSSPMLTGLPPIIGGSPSVLILGNMPSVLSLAGQQYYGNPRNAFWRITGSIFEFSADAEYDDRCAALVGRGRRRLGRARVVPTGR